MYIHSSSQDNSSHSIFPFSDFNRTLVPIYRFSRFHLSFFVSYHDIDSTSFPVLVGVIVSILDDMSNWMMAFHTSSKFACNVSFRLSSFVPISSAVLLSLCVQRGDTRCGYQRCNNASPVLRLLVIGCRESVCEREELNFFESMCA